MVAGAGLFVAADPAAYGLHGTASQQSQPEKPGTFTAREASKMVYTTQWRMHGRGSNVDSIRGIRVWGDGDTKGSTMTVALVC